MKYPPFPVSDFSEFITLSDSDRVRFQRHLIAGPKETDCVLWSASVDDWGYGVFGVKRSTGKFIIVKAHRLSWVFSGLEITIDKPFILHSCDNPLCCNALHLWAGTNADNQRDKAKKDRGRKGSLGLPRGVTLRGDGKFRARIWRNLKYEHLGVFDSLEDAREAVTRERSLLYRQQV